MTSKRNKTIHLTDSDRIELKPYLSHAMRVSPFAEDWLNKIILGDTFEVLPKLPAQIADLVIIDPPYNLYKQFCGLTFGKRPTEAYTDYLRSIFKLLVPLLKPTASVYCCSDWHTSFCVQYVAQEFWKIRSRITWEREKGRGASRNWKNAHEDAWFCTVSENYTFNVNDVKLRRKVIAPYRDAEGKPKDWSINGTRDTFPSNLWTDITVPFWSMSENTDHPTQKPEKFCAKLILASSNPGDVVLDPMMGVGTVPTVAKKLGRKYIGIELQEDFALIAQKRLKLAETDTRIAGYHDGVFWERNANRA